MWIQTSHSSSQTTDRKTTWATWGAFQHNRVTTLGLEIDCEQTFCWQMDRQAESSTHWLCGAGHKDKLAAYLNKLIVGFVLDGF